MLAGKRIILGITGSIAAYKSAEIVRRLKAANADVTVVMTKGGMEFITPLTMQTLSCNPVYTETFVLQRDSRIAHIELVKSADMFLIAPATANIIGKIAAGVGDDVLTTMVLSARCPVLIAPAMDSDMYENPIVQRNITFLKESDYRFIEPEEGELASGIIGKGRLADIEKIISSLIDILVVKKDLAGEVVLVTAGPTREYIDPVRFISNRSTGKMGYAIAEAAKSRGAEVILISGPASLKRPAGVEFINAVTAEEMMDEVKGSIERATIVVMTAAVSDYMPVKASQEKIKKSGKDISIALTEVTDILSEIGRNKGTRVVVGFAAETNEIINNAISKLKGKNLDMVVANDVSNPDAGFEVDTNIITIIEKDGIITEHGKMSKKEAAHRIFDKIVSLKRRYSNPVRSLSC